MINIGNLRLSSSQEEVLHFFLKDECTPAYVDGLLSALSEDRSGSLFFGGNVYEVSLDYDKRSASIDYNLVEEKDAELLNPVVVSFEILKVLLEERPAYIDLLDPLR